MKKIPGTKSKEEIFEAVIFAVNDNPETPVIKIEEEKAVIIPVELDNDHESIKEIKK
jgi:hypothetical protein